jgi:fido (protein-threonine AMPylation protein)
MTESTDPYLYPGTDVLKSLRGIREPDIQASFEAEATTRRIVELIHSPTQGRFDTAHLRAIHKHVFQDVSCGPVNFGQSTSQRTGIFLSRLALSRVP